MVAIMVTPQSGQNDSLEVAVDVIMSTKRSHINVIIKQKCFDISITMVYMHMVMNDVQLHAIL